jgi:hypothetical protein
MRLGNICAQATALSYQIRMMVVSDIGRHFMTYLEHVVESILTPGPYSSSLHHSGAFMSLLSHWHALAGLVLFASLVTVKCHRINFKIVCMLENRYITCNFHKSQAFKRKCIH